MGKFQPVMITHRKTLRDYNIASVKNAGEASQRLLCTYVEVDRQRFGNMLQTAMPISLLL